MRTKRNRAFQIWNKVGGPQAGTITAVAIGKDDEYTVFIGAKVGLYRSTGFDGVSVLGWERLAAAPIGIMSLAVSPQFAEDHTIVVGTDTGIYVSRDAGEIWRAAQTPFSKSMVIALGFSPNYADDGILLAGTLEDGIWYSYTRGESWQARNFGLLDATAFCLTFSPNFATDETIYAGTDTAIYHSYNGARAWKQLNFPESAVPVLSLAMSLDFESDHTLYAGTEKEGLYRSVNRGESWERLSLPDAVASVNALLASKNSLLAATDSGVFQSTDKGETWSCLVEIPNAISLASQDEIVMAGWVDQGAWTTTGLADWKPVSVPSIRSIFGLILSPAFENDHMAFMYGLQEGVWRTEDGGATWTCINEALPGIDIHAVVTSPDFSKNHVIVATSPDGVFLSPNAGDHWQTLAEQSAGRAAFSPDGKLLAVAFDEEGIRISGGLGQTWRNIPGPWDEGGKIVALSVTNDRRFYAAMFESADDMVRIWQGKPGGYENVVSQPCNKNPVVSFWVPVESGAREPWYASLGSKVWKFSLGVETTIVECSTLADAIQNEDILSLTGIQGPTGYTLFACTGRHLYKLVDAKSWIMIHDFGDDTALSFTLSPFFLSNKTAYALLLGGTFCRGKVTG